MKLSEYQFVFDLDDTLYKETTYVRSALRHVGRILNIAYGGADFCLELENSFDGGSKNPIQDVCTQYSLPKKTFNIILNSMQCHSPIISLDQKISILLRKLKKYGGVVSILSDGRSITQRIKIDSLDLNWVDAILISEEIGDSKPSQKGYKLLQEKFSRSKNFYIGDNPEKDFYAPNAMGWVTVQLKDNGQNLHKQNTNLPKEFQAHHEIVSLNELVQLPEINGDWSAK